MDQTRINEMIGAIRSGVEQAISANPSPEDAVLAPLIELVGELLLDVKRIADASGPPVHLHFHCPEGAVLNAVGDTVRIEPWVPPASASTPLLNLEPLARFLAAKEAGRKFPAGAETNSREWTEERARAVRTWIDGNWRAFQREADELLAVASGAVS